MAIPNDPQYGQLWAAKNTGQAITTGTYPAGAPVTGTIGDDMNLEAAWNVQTDCGTITVAVIDSGVNYNSTDLAANMWNGTSFGAPLHGWNFVGAGSNDPMDLNGHGTHVAGTIGAVGNNNTGVTGVCWKASIMAVRAMDVTGSGTTSSIIQSIDFAINNGAKIINMSLGGSGPLDPAFSSAITRAQTANVLVVVAAGNENANNETTPSWPCNFTQPNLICVAALDQNYALASFSNWGATSVDVAAPGTNILSTWNGLHTVINDPLTAGAGSWAGSSTTAAAGGGWGNDTVNTGWLFNPISPSWGTTFYNAATDDRTFKTFNLTGANAATLTAYAAINVQNGDFFNTNFKAAGGDPFVTGTPIFSATNMKDGLTAYRGQFDISGCISATCSIGSQLTSTPTSLRDIGVGITRFSIDKLTLNTTSYNTIDGTSMATPQVTGVAALVWAHNPLFTYVEVANAIKNSGRTIPALVGKTTSGKAVDAMRALAYINPPTGIAEVMH
jgi:thermitase